MSTILQKRRDMVGCFELSVYCVFKIDKCERKISGGPDSGCRSLEGDIIYYV